MTRHLFVVTAFLTLLAGCAGLESKQVSVINNSDKSLTCQEVAIETAEARFYLAAAQENKAPGLDAIITPLSYISTYRNAMDAERSALDRIDYLREISTIMGCDVPQQRGYSVRNVTPALQAPQPRGYRPASNQEFLTAGEHNTSLYHHTNRGW